LHFAFLKSVSHNGFASGFKERTVAELSEHIKKFYSTSKFLSFYTEKFRLDQVKSALANTKTSPAERLQWIKYLDAHMGDVPAKGPDSGVVEIKTYSVDALKKAMEGE
jgi:hypothetical protein